MNHCAHVADFYMNKAGNAKDNNQLMWLACYHNFRFYFRESL